MTTLLMFLFIAAVFAGLYAILAFGYQSMEADRAKAEAPTTQKVLEQRRFFAKTDEAAPAARIPLVPISLVAMLEERLQQDYQGAMAFASSPSKERICNGYDAYVDAVASDLERRIRRDRAATSGFVAKPSVEGLLCNPPHTRLR
jgi:hypothetical protein